MMPTSGMNALPRGSASTPAAIGTVGVAGERTPHRLPLREGMLDHAAHRDAVAVARAVVGCMSSPAGSCR